MGIRDKVVGGRYLVTMAVALALASFALADVIIVVKDSTAKIPFDLREIMTAVIIFYFAKGPEDVKKDPPKDESSPPKQV